VAKRDPGSSVDAQSGGQLDLPFSAAKRDPGFSADTQSGRRLNLPLPVAKRDPNMRRGDTRESSAEEAAAQPTPVRPDSTIMPGTLRHMAEEASQNGHLSDHAAMSHILQWMPILFKGGN
jgi:hypothetical protein